MSRLSRMMALGLLPRAAARPPQQAAQRIKGAWVWEGGADIDADGAPTAYALPGSGLVGLDAIGNAGSPGHYYGLACDGDTPYVQGPGDPAPGFAISQTALVDATKAVNDPRRYVNAAAMPYLVTPPDLEGVNGVRLGDFGLLIYHGRRVDVVVADVGPRGHFGEISPAAAVAAGIPSSPRNGGVSAGVTCIIWPGSAQTPKWPHTVAEVTAAVDALLASYGDPTALIPWLAQNV